MPLSSASFSFTFNTSSSQWAAYTFRKTNSLIGATTMRRSWRKCRKVSCLPKGGGNADDTRSEAWDSQWATRVRCRWSMACHASAPLYLQHLPWVQKRNQNNQSTIFLFYDSGSPIFVEPKSYSSISSVNQRDEYNKSYSKSITQSCEKKEPIGVHKKLINKRILVQLRR